MILGIIIAFLFGGLIGAMCMGLMVASGRRNHAEEEMDRWTEVSHPTAKAGACKSPD